MSWTRLDDSWTDDPALADLAFETRWHYLALIQFCSRTSRYDGVVRVADARRCSDVGDPAGCHDELVAAGFLAPSPDGCLRVIRIADHVLPPSMRDETRKAAQRARKARSRGGRTKLVTREVTREVTPDVTRDTGTGRDGTGRAGTQELDASAETAVTCAVCGRQSSWSLIDGRCRKCAA